MPDQKELEELARRRVAEAERRRAETLIYHPELLEPISVPALHYAMIPMQDYERFRDYGELVTALQDSLEYGRLVGKLEGYRKVLEHVKGSAVLGAGIVNRAGLEEQLERIIAALDGDVARFNVREAGVVSVDRSIDTDTVVGVLHIKRGDLKEASPARVHDLVHEAVELLREELLEKLVPPLKHPTPAGADLHEGRPSEGIHGSVR